MRDIIALYDLYRGNFLHGQSRYHQSPGPIKVHNSSAIKHQKNPPVDTLSVTFDCKRADDPAGISKRAVKCPCTHPARLAMTSNGTGTPAGKVAQLRGDHPRDRQRIFPTCLPVQPYQAMCVWMSPMLSLIASLSRLWNTMAGIHRSKSDSIQLRNSRYNVAEIAIKN